MTVDCRELDLHGGCQAAGRRSPLKCKKCCLLCPDVAECPEPCLAARGLLFAGVQSSGHKESIRNGRQNHWVHAFEYLGISKRAVHVLRHNGVDTVDELTRCTPRELEGMIGLGQKGRKDIERALDTRGLKLGGEVVTERD